MRSRLLAAGTTSIVRDRIPRRDTNGSVYREEYNTGATGNLEVFDIPSLYASDALIATTRSSLSAVAWVGEEMKCNKILGSFLDSNLGTPFD